MKQSERRQNSRREILCAAMEEFGAHGYGGVSVESLLAAAQDFGDGAVWHCGPGAALREADFIAGWAGECDAAAYLEERFSGMGYSVTRLPYADDAGRTGSTVWWP